jgi:chitin synthase
MESETINVSAADIIKFIITSISFVDFIVFSTLFITFMITVYRKSNKNNKRVAASVIVGFLIYKLLHIPIFLLTETLYPIDIPYGDVFIGILAWSNMILAIVPLILSVYSSFIKQPPSVEALSKNADKQVFVIMPIYNEEPASLWKAVQSVEKLQYNKSKMHLFLAFDDNNEPAAFQYLTNKLLAKPLKDQKVFTIDSNGLLITVCRFPHAGKKSAQSNAFKLVQQYYGQNDLSDALVFFIDSEIQLKSDCLLHFNYHMQKYDKLCLTGLVSCVNSCNPTFLTYYQDIEYISGQLITRNTENFLGASTCLPGAFTIMKYTVLEAVSSEYFKTHVYDDNFDYHRLYLGEDRYLTHLLMEKYPWSIGFCQYARCKTDAPASLSGLLNQRRRWYLGHMSNDVWMMSSWILWKNYPLLSLFNFLNNARNMSIYIYLIYFLLLLNDNVSLVSWILFIILPLALNWLFLTLYALRIRRRMNIVFYIVIILLQPIFSATYMYYTMFTLRKRTWGGVRVQKSENGDNNV